MEQKVKKAVLFINMGSPLAPTWFQTARYLFQLFRDKRMMPFSLFLRVLFAFRIAPFRALVMKKRYAKIWHKGLSPLCFYTKKLCSEVQKQFQTSHIAAFCMRYGSPSIKSVLSQLEGEKIDELFLFPLFPQYTSQVTGSCIEEVLRHLSQWKRFPHIQLLSSFYNEEFFRSSLSFLIQETEEKEGPFDRVLFSFHALPEGPDTSRYSKECETIAQSLNSSEWTIAFQSRFGKGLWTGPAIEDVLRKMIEQGKKRILIVTPSFVADCVETLYDLQIHKDRFLSEGGEKCIILPCLNAHPLWVKKIAEFLGDCT